VTELMRIGAMLHRLKGLLTMDGSLPHFLFIETHSPSQRQ
jgi:hypothetical protein